MNLSSTGQKCFRTVFLVGHEKLLTESGMVVLVVGLNTAANSGRSLFIYSSLSAFRVLNLIICYYCSHMTRSGKDTCNNDLG